MESNFEIKIIKYLTLRFGGGIQMWPPPPKLIRHMLLFLQLCLCTRCEDHRRHSPLPSIYTYTRFHQIKGARVRLRAENGIELEMALPKAKEIVSSNPVVVFSKTFCPYCVSVKKLLSGLGATFKAIELDSESDGRDIQAALLEWTGQRTVPNVFVGGSHIGGCDATTSLHLEGKLVPLLTEAGALAKTS